MTPKWPDLLPGDCLLYFQNSIFDWIVAFKTWNKIAHVEIYVGQGKSVASRNGVGVDMYDVRWEGLAVARRPTAPFNLDAARNWFYSKAKGEAYDFVGLLCFAMAVKQGSPDKMFCSEFATRYYRAGGLRVFSPDYDADRIAPAQFLQTPALDTFWEAAK